MSGTIRATRPRAATDPLQPFVPRIAADWLRDMPATHARSFEGTLVFADVSGFTELTEKLARRGREGAEEIAVVLDAAFAELIGAAYAYHADLLKFGGDAVLLLCRGEGHEQRAASAALGMQDALTGMRRLSTSVGPVRLRVSIGVHSGTFQFFLVGGVHRELIVAGADATVCVQTEAIANAGEVALSAATARHFPPHLLGETRDGVVLLTGRPDTPTMVPPFFDPSGVDLSRLLPAAYTRELRGEPADPEHRHVAVAFVEIRATDELLEREGPEALADALDERISTIQESCLSFDVTFAQTDVSKEAVKAILIAGAPRSAGGDEEELVLRAARAIVERPGILPVRVGVNAGRVFAGIVGPPTRRTYTFYGDAINTAARIMARATDGQLLAHVDVLERARTTYAATPVEPFAAKGKAELVHASDIGPAVGEREPDVIGPFVGREHELDVLLGALARAREGNGALAIVTGDPGLGKTRLLGELRAQASGVPSIRVQCSQAGANRPYLAAGAIVRGALQLGSHAPEPEVERRLRDAVGAAAPELEPWLPLLGLVVGLDLAPTPETAALDERFVGERIATSFEALLDGIVPDAALVVVDDAHWMDQASAELIDRVASGIHSRRGLLVVARRDDEGGYHVAEGVDAIDVPLAPLDPSAALLLTEQLTEDAPLPRHVADAIVAAIRGQPAVRVGDGRRSASRGRARRAPGVGRGTDGRADRRAPSADRTVLRRASVLGSRFTRDSLVAALELDEARTEAVIRRLERFIVADGEGGLRFRHGLVRDAAYHGLSFRSRRQLHRRVAEAFERDAGADVAAVADQLTHHFFEAGVWEKALRYGFVAGSAAHAVYANVDAAALLDQAVAAGRRWRGARPEAVARAEEALGDVRLGLGEFERARSAFAAARRRVHGDAVERARLLRKEATVAYRLGAYPEAQRILTRALALIEAVSSVPATGQRARIEAWLGIITLWRGRPRDAVEWLQRAVADGEAVGAKEAVAHALLGLHRAFNALGESGARTRYGPRALALHDELGDLVSKGGVLNNLGADAYYEGRWNEALDLYRAGARSMGAGRRHAERVHGVLQHRRDPFGAGQSRRRRSPCSAVPSARARASGGATEVAEMRMETALLEARQGNIAQALAQLDEIRAGLAGVLTSGGVAGTLLVDARIAETLLLGGEYDRAAELARSTLGQASGRRRRRARPAGASPCARAGSRAHGAVRCCTRGARTGGCRSHPCPVPVRGGARTRRPRSRRPAGGPPERGGGAPGRPLRSARDHRPPRRVGRTR